MTFQVVASLVVTAVVAYVLLSRSNASSIPLPPGPKGYPIIGNLLDMPEEVEWKKYREWSRQYGEQRFTSD